MRKWNVFAIALVVPLLAQPACILHAHEDPYHHIQQSVLADVHATIVRSIGAQDETVEITVADKVLIVSRVNSNMNDSTHSGRDNEATAIAAIISKAISGKSEFDNVVTLRVDYVARAVDGDSKVIDSVEFREDPKGDFRFHRT
jgi:hypothetical protein